MSGYRGDNKPGKFSRGDNPGTRVCANCGLRRQAANMATDDTCRACMDGFEGYNSVSDNGLDAGRPRTTCPKCGSPDAAIIESGSIACGVCWFLYPADWKPAK